MASSPVAEEPKGFSSAIEHNHPGLVARQMPDVPEDILTEDNEYYQEHLNDLYLDLRATRPSSVRRFSIEDSEKKKIQMGYDNSDIDTESQFDRYSTSRAESAVDFDDESPYPEVRAAVSSVDDPLMPVNTFRMWFLGIFFVFGITFVNQILGLRFPAAYITGIVIQLVALPCGKALEKILPRTVFNFFGYRWSFNPGPFSIKEHVCITIMANVVFAGVFALEVTLSQRVWYGMEVSKGYQMLLALGSQCFGFCLGGFLRQFVVWPSSMIWPGALVNSALFNTLHKNYGQRDRGHMTRERFFLIAFAGSFLWYFVPGYLFTGLSMFSWVCWIAPENVTVNALFGVNSGLGMSMLTFDWGMIAFIGSPLVTPWWSELNTAVAFILIYWFLTPILYFTNTWDSAHFPLSSYLSWDNTGNMYDATAVLTDGVFDQAKYDAYSPVYMSVTLALAYGVAFAAFPAVIVHTFLWFRKDIVRRFRSTLKDERDVHSRLMQYYPETPAWWFLVVGVISLIFLIVAVEVYPTQLPVWALFLCLFVAAVLALPLAMLQAITNQQVPTQVLHELIAGYVLPGRPVANMLCKSIGFITGTQAVAFAGDLKLGHYMKIPPRLIFAIQIISTIISAVLCSVIQDFMLENIEDICTPGQKQGFTCPGSTTWFTASVIWGGVAPKRVFSIGQRYAGVLLFFPIGIILPIPFYFLARRYPLSFWRYVNIPVFFAGLGAMPPASGINYISWALVGFIFNYVIRKFHFRWWMRYNYILSAALDSGTAIGGIVVFLLFALPKGGIELNWWGNNVWINTADANGTPLLPIPEGTTI